MASFAEWVDRLPVLLMGALLLVMLAVAEMVGSWLRRRHARRSPAAEEGDGGSLEGYIIPAALGLLALLLGFTFSMAVDRYETRRMLVLREANAIGTAYLRSQALAEPHRSRMSKVLVDYTSNRIALATAERARQPGLLATNDRLLVDLWAATLAANDSLQASPFSVSFLAPVNEVIDLDASRKAARRVRVPREVLLVLWIYIGVTAGILGYARSESSGRRLAGTLAVLVTLSYMLILDIDRPATGAITEGQGPMIALRETLAKEPPGTFDRWREPVPAR